MTMTEKDLQMRFKAETGFTKEKYSEDYYEWVEKQLLEKLNKELEFEGFMNEIAREYV